MRQNGIKRLICTALAFVTVLAAVPYFAAHTDAAGAAPALSAFYDFEDGTANGAMTKEYLSKTEGFSGNNASNVVFFQDPTGSENIVVGRKSSAKNCNFRIGDDNGVLLTSPFSLEMDVYIVSFPVAVENSGDPLALFAWNNGSYNLPLLRVDNAGALYLTNENNGSGKTAKPESYTLTDKTLTGKTWHKVRLDVSPIGDFAALYVDGEFVMSTAIPNLSSSSYVRIFQPNGQWEIYADNLSIKTYGISEYDVMMDFESIPAGKELTNAYWGTMAFPYCNSKMSNSVSLATMVDPKDPENIVVGNTGNDFCFYLYDKQLFRLPTTDFVVSADFRFSAFPTELETGADKPTPIFTWVTGSSSYAIFCRIDKDGNLLDANSKPTGVILDLNEWYNVAVHCDGATGRYDLYVNGSYVTAGSVGKPATGTSNAQIRVLISGQSSQFGVMVDDVQLYEAERVVRTTAVDDVIWDVDFEAYAENKVLTADDINAMTDIADLGTGHTAWSKKGKIAFKDGSNWMKMSNITVDQMLDLCVGNAEYDPLKNGTVKVAFDINVEAFGQSFIYLARWMRRDTSGDASKRNTVNVLCLKSEDGEKGYLVLKDVATSYVVEKNKTYRVELIFNTQLVDGVLQSDVSLRVNDGNGFVTVVANSGGWSQTVLGKENFAYFLDDAGVQRYLPYAGLVKSFRYDKDGNKVTDGNGNPAFVDKLVFKTNTLPDTLRMFQGANESGAKDFVFCVDDLKIEKLDSAPDLTVEKGDFSIGFEDTTDYMSAIQMLESGWQLGTVGTSRAEIIGDADGKFLRVDHTDLTANRPTYVEVTNAEFLKHGQYLIETSVRYGCTTAFNLTVAEVYRAATGKSAPLLSVRGDSNKMYVTVRGMQYDVVDAAGNIIRMETIPADEAAASAGFTDVAVLVDNTTSTYTLYINGELAYYLYEGKALPCVGLSMHFMQSLVAVSEDLVRILEIPEVKQAQSVMDVRCVAVRSLAGGIGATAKGSQIRVNDAEETVDIRFLAGVDSLYGSAVGFEITADYIDAKGNYTVAKEITTTTVFEEIRAAGMDVTAEELGSKYISAVQINDIPQNITVTFTVKTYMACGDSKYYGDSYTVTLVKGAVSGEASANAQ